MDASFLHQKRDIALVWFKRDLRVWDHQPLAAAASQGAVLPIYIVEPDFWTLPDAAARHWRFVADCLTDLQTALANLGQPLMICKGEAVTVLQTLVRSYNVTGLFSHEETGNGWTYARDQRVRAWCREQGIAWHEVAQHGVKRRLLSRDGWARAWDQKMAESLCKPPPLTPLTTLDLGAIPTEKDLSLSPDPCPERQSGGRSHGWNVLQSFLTKRGENYRSDMSNPLKGATSCSRISPYLAWGCLSVREVSQAAEHRRQTLRKEGIKGRWNGALSSFTGRLHWHCHFIQKLEDDPSLEFENLHKAYDGLRPKTPDQTRLTAWATGQTGLPFVDACMRSLIATGWLNFRMRAMLMAVASYHLWLDWRATGEHLARSFTDYEPGIHWPQVQMQSGTTGINTIRIYNPVKQGYDQDPTGEFTHRWVPELAGVEDKFLQEPWKSDAAGQILDTRYPMPIVDHLSAAKEAREKIWAVRGGADFKTKAKLISDKHGSRRAGIKMRGQRAKKPQDDRQLGFSFNGS